MKKATIKDIAQIAGVDHSTVSRALNNSPRVSRKTKERIVQIAEDMHFEFNVTGRTLRKGKSGNIAVIYAGNWQVFGSTQYFNILLNSIRRELEIRKLDAFILEAYSQESGESNIERLLKQQKVDGFLL
ncbi:MAG: LacI family DNA-binding transcriptional regulator, partial [Spirochaetales bacterium]|nr:LacI family DNA-binding transcriptional regulator [Spirochaetales bacterium]